MPNSPPVDVDEIDDILDEVPSSRKAQTQPPSSSLAPLSGNLGVSVAGGAIWLIFQARQLPRRFWIIGSLTFVALLFYLSQMKPPPPPEKAANPYDNRSLQAYRQANDLKQTLADIDDAQAVLTDTLEQERQRSLIRTAQGFRSLAAFYMAQPNHLCNGKSEPDCLGTFMINRIRKLEEISDRKGAPASPGSAVEPSKVIDPTLWTLSEVDRVSALRLAVVLAKPGETRRSWEQDWLNRSFPLLNQGLPVEELASQQPGVLARQLRRVGDRQQELVNGTPESFSRLEREQARQQQQSQR